MPGNGPLNNKWQESPLRKIRRSTGCEHYSILFSSLDACRILLGCKYGGMQSYRHLLFESYKSSGKRLWDPCTRNSNNLMFLYLALQCFTQLHGRFIRVEYILKFHDSREFCRSSSMHKTDAIAHSAHVPESHNVNPLQDACTWYLFSGSDPPQDKRKQFAINYAYACLDCIQFHASLLWCWAFHQLIVVVCMNVITLMHHHLLL